MRKYPGDLNGAVARFELHTGAAGIVQPSRQLGKSDCRHATGALADLRLSGVAALDLPLAGSNQFWGWAANDHGAWWRYRRGQPTHCPAWPYAVAGPVPASASASSIAMGHDSVRSMSCG